MGQATLCRTAARMLRADPWPGRLECDAARAGSAAWEGEQGVAEGKGALFATPQRAFHSAHSISHTQRGFSSHMWRNENARWSGQLNLSHRALSTSLGWGLASAALSRTCLPRPLRSPACERVRLGTASTRAASCLGRLELQLVVGRGGQEAEGTQRHEVRA